MLAKLTSIALLVVLGFVALASADAAETPGLTVTAKPDKKQVQANKPFEVKLRVVNSSASPQSLRVMNCSWDEHWKSSNDKVAWLSWACTKNFEVTVKLEPGAAYEKKFDVMADGEPGKDVNFKLGFTSIGSKQTYWSDEVKVQIVK